MRRLLAIVALTFGQPALAQSWWPWSGYSGSTGECLVNTNGTVGWGSCGTFAPTGAGYWTSAADGTLSAEKNLGALSTGLVLNTSGTPSAYAGSSCSAGQYATSANASGALSCSAPAFSELSGTATDAQLASSYSGVGACSSSRWVSTLNDNASPTCTQPAFSDLSGTATDAQLASSYSGVGACSSNKWVSTLNDNASPTCTQPAFSDLSGAATDAQIPDSITVTLAATATALAANPSDCGANTFAQSIVASGALTCASVNLASADVTGVLPVANGGAAITKLANNVGVNVNASYLTVFSYTPPASSSITFIAHVAYLSSANTVGLQLRVRSADANNVGNCVITTYGVAGTAASATANEWDVIAIGSNPSDDASAASCSANACLKNVECTFVSGSSPGAVILEAQLETGTTSQNILAGATYYSVVTN